MGSNQCSFHFSCMDRQHEERRTILLGLHTALCQRLFLIMTVCDPFFWPHKETEEVLKEKQQNETDPATLVLWDKRKDVSDVTVPPNAHVETLLVSVKIIWASIFWMSCWVKRFYSRIKKLRACGRTGLESKSFSIKTINTFHTFSVVNMLNAHV